MEELSRLAARVWKRVARGEAYDVKPTPKPKPVKNDSWLLLLLVLAVLHVGLGNCRGGH